MASELSRVGHGLRTGFRVDLRGGLSNADPKLKSPMGCGEGGSAGRVNIAGSGRGKDKELADRQPCEGRGGATGETWMALRNLMICGVLKSGARSVVHTYMVCSADEPLTPLTSHAKNCHATLRLSPKCISDSSLETSQCGT